MFYQSLTTKFLLKGGEFDVLKSINFDVLSFGVIFFESDEHNPLKNIAIRTFLESKGMFDVMKSFFLSLPVDVSLIKPNHRISIYGP